MSSSRETFDLLDASGAGLAGLSEAVRGWDPALDAGLLRGAGLLYDPDATLYALSLGGPVVLSTDRRRREVAAGGVVAVPRAIGIGVEPASDFLTILDLGPPPGHFRERFLQVWGFEELGGVEGQGRHRVGATSWRPGTEGGVEPDPGPAWGLDVWVGIEGEIVLSGPEDGPRTLRGGTAAALASGAPLRLSGSGYGVRLRLSLGG